MLFAKTLALLSIMSAAYGYTGDSDAQLEVVAEKGISTSSLESAELVAAKRVLAFLKGKIGGEEIQSLLADDIAPTNIGISYFPTRPTHGSQLKPKQKPSSTRSS
jgi:hypothetical protein